MKPRIKTSFHPQWPGPIEGYSINLIKRYFPRLQAAYEFEDLIQESYIKFLQCQKCYAGKINNPAWFMSLYKRALINQFNTFLERVTRYNFISYEDLEQITGPLNRTDPGSEIDVMNVVKGLPEEFLSVLKDMTELTEISQTGLAVVKEGGLRAKNVKSLHKHLRQAMGMMKANNVQVN